MRILENIGIWAVTNPGSLLILGAKHSVCNLKPLTSDYYKKNPREQMERRIRANAKPQNVSSRFIIYAKNKEISYTKE